MSSPYLEETFHPFIEARGGEPAITWVTEREALGTGGAIVSVARPHLGDEPFFALNGDILTDLDLTAMLAGHGERSAAVDDRPAPRRGRPRFRARGDGSGPGGSRNSGRSRPTRSRVTSTRGPTCWSPPPFAPGPGGPSLDRNGDLPDVDPDGAAGLRVRSDAYWLDLGTPEQYLRAHVDLLAGRVARRPRTGPVGRAGRSRGPVRAHREVGRRSARAHASGPRRSSTKPS